MFFFGGEVERITNKFLTKTNKNKLKVSNFDVDLVDLMDDFFTVD